MMNETPRRPSRRGVAIGAVLLALAAASYVEFISPSLRSTTRDLFGYRSEVQLELVTSKSPLLGRVVRSEARLISKRQVLVRTQGAYVYEELWTKRDELRKFSQVCLTEGKSESRILYALLTIISLKTGDEELNRFLAQVDVA